MPDGREKLNAALVAIDAANAADPSLEDDGGSPRPKELVYAERMSRWLDILVPDADDALRIAARAQHIERWSIPRHAYPDGRTGYLQWRKELQRFHAARTGEILDRTGYDGALIDKVQALLMKRNLKSDADMQALEDVICLVFLESYFADFSAKHEDDKVVDIVRKTWKKMSPRGHEAALTLVLPEPAKRLVERALAAA
jgi:hypothetical protein